MRSDFQRSKITAP